VTLYVDSSALLKRYVDEHDSDAAVELMTTDPVLLTSRITEVEVRHNLSRLLDATPLHAARIAEQTLCRSLDALHVASALRAGAATVLLTFDIRQARTARAMGLTVIGS
jgi:predicted nucleic acid-binding protein